MELRTCIESKRNYYLNGAREVNRNNPYYYPSSSSRIVECPNSMDVIFRKGKNSTAHPGNARFQSLIQRKYEEYINIRYDNREIDKLLQLPSRYKSETSTTTSASHMTLKPFILNIINETLENSHGGGRFLTWKVLSKNDENGKSGLTGYWTEFTDEKQIFYKIKRMVLKFKYPREKSHLNNHCTGGCRVKKSNIDNGSDLVKKSEKKTLENDILDQGLASDMSHEISNEATTTSLILQSDTSMFQNLNGSDKSRQYRNLEEEMKNVTNTTSTIPGECFGQGFFCTS